MRFASVAEVKNGLSAYLERARKRKEPVVIARHGKPCALSQSMNRTSSTWSGRDWPHGVSARLGNARTMSSTTIYRRCEVVIVDVPFSGPCRREVSARVSPQCRRVSPQTARSDCLPDQQPAALLQSAWRIGHFSSAAVSHVYPPMWTVTAAAAGLGCFFGKGIL